MIVSRPISDRFRMVLVACPLGSPHQIPLALPCLAAFVKEQGYEVECLDLNREFWDSLPIDLLRSLDDTSKWQGLKVSPQVESTLESLAGHWAERILFSKPSVVGFSANLVNVRASLVVAAAVKRIDPSVVTVLGGPECLCSWPQLICDSAVDFVVLGDGEFPLVQLLEALITRSDPRSIQSLMCEGGELANAKPAANLDLDRLPYPDFSMMDIQGYACQGAFELPIYSSAGCTGNCTFCARPFLNGRHRCKSAQRVVSELEHHYTEYGAREFYFVDSLINGNIDQLATWTSDIARRQVPVQWRANATLSPQLRKGLLDTMYRSGCRRLNYGLESASPQVLKSMRKYSNIPIIERVIRDTHEIGIFVACFIIVGYPGETQADFEMTLEFLLRNKNYIDAVQVSSCYVIPNTFLQQHKPRYGIVGEIDTWYNSTSTPEIRALRRKQLRHTLEELSISEFYPV